MDWLFWIAIILFVFIVSVYAYSKGFNNGYKAGHRKGFDIGKREINEYLLKLNRALGERIEEMDSRK